MSKINNKIKYSHFRIGDICEIVKGKTPTMKAIPGEFPLVVTAENRKSCNEYQIDDEAICVPLVSSTGHGHASIKRIHYQNGKFAIANIMAAIIPKDKNKFFPKYLYYLFNVKKEEYFVSLMAGTANVSLKMSEIRNVLISSPSINEQKKIVKKTEQLLKEIDEIKILLENTELQIKQFRKSLLYSTFEKLNQKYDCKKLNDLCAKITDGTHHSPKYVQEGIPFLSAKHIRDENVYFDNCKYVSQETHDDLIKRCNPEIGDVLITKSGTIGRTAIIDTEKPFSLFVSVALLKPLNLLDRNYLKYFLQNFINTIDISEDIKGAVIKNFHLEDIRKVMIPIPSKKIQVEIISKIVHGLSVIENTEKISNSMLLQVQTLQSSIFNQFFTEKPESQ